MKKLIRTYLREVIGLFVAGEIAVGLVFQDGLQSLLIAGAALAVAAYLVRPIINILILPLTLATLGLFKFVSHAITLYIVDLALPQFAITNFDFPGLTTQYFNLPPVMFNQGPMAYIGFSLTITILTTVIHWVAK